MKRYAIVRNADSRRQAEAYLPGNYEIVAETKSDAHCRHCGTHTTKSDHAFEGKPEFVIAGEDSHGWTLDDYVIPRYASGLIWAEEIDEAHIALRAVGKES